MTDQRRPESYTRAHPVATNLECPCGARLSGDNVHDDLLRDWHDRHDDHVQDERIG